MLRLMAVSGHWVTGRPPCSRGVTPSLLAPGLAAPLVSILCWMLSGSDMEYLLGSANVADRIRCVQCMPDLLSRLSWSPNNRLLQAVLSQLLRLTSCNATVSRLT